MGGKGRASQSIRVPSGYGHAEASLFAARQAFVNRVLLLTLATGMVILAASFFPEYDPTPVIILYVSALIAYGGLRLWLERGFFSNPRSWLHLAVDVLVVSLFVYFTGGLASRFSWVYILLLFRTNILRGQKGMVVTFGGAVLLLWTQAWLIYLDLIPHFVMAPEPVDPHSSLPFMLVALGAYTLVLGLILRFALFFQEARQRASLRSSHIAAMQALVSAAEARSPQAGGQGVRVTRYATAIAQEMRVHILDIVVIQDAALVHDVGQALLPPEVVRQTGPLDPVQQAELMTHPLVSAEVLKSTGVLEALAPLARHHHEWFDGTGYPDGLAGEAIPLGARILAVADAFEALTAGGRNTPEQALEEIQRKASAQFDPQVVAALRAVWGKGQVTVAKLALEEPPHPGGGRPLVNAALPWTVGMRASTQQKAATALLRIGQDVSSVLDLDALGARLGTIVQETLVCEGGAFFSRPQPGALMLHWGVGHWAGQAGKSLSPREGPVAHALGTGDAARFPDTRALPAFAEEPFAGGSVLLLPLREKTAVIGLLVLERSQPGSFTEEELRLVQAIAPHISALLEVALLHRQTAEAAITDALTGLYNYRYFSQRLEDEIARSRRLGKPLTLAVLDVDKLKQINDTHGHLTGDAVLRAVSAALKQTVRASDVVARYGGDEFAVILSETGREDAETVMNRVAGLLQGHLPLASPDGCSLPPSNLSWGLAAYPDDGTNATALFARADKALYERRQARRRLSG